MPTDPPTHQIIADCPSCGAQSDVTAHEPFTRVSCPSCEEQFHARDRFHHFVIQEHCASGGMSRVYRAMDASLERAVALKILNRTYSQDSVRVRQFEKEAEITARVSHPNVVRVFTAGRDQGYFYLAMELVSGGTLEEKLRNGAKLPEALVLEIAIQAVQGLAAAHKAGLIHRDIKPGNILFAEDGTPKIVDFGLAIFARDADGSGEIWATPYYVPPETLNHEPEDFRSDIYALGATLYHALLGRPPCEKDSAPLAELRVIKSKPIHVKPAATKLSEETCAVLERALAVKRENRYRSYEEFLDHLKYAQRRLRRGGKGKPWPGRRRSGPAPWQWTAAAAFLVLLGGGIYMARDKTVEKPRATGGGLLVMDADPTAGSDNTTSTRYNQARDLMLAADFEKARPLFEELGGNSATPQPARNWSRWNAGLCALFTGDNSGARHSYEAIARDGPFSSASDQKGLAQFFVTASQWLAADSPVPVGKMQDCSVGDPSAIGLLAAGLKNWNHGEAATAAAFLKAFRDASPPGWVANCQRLTGDHLADAAAIAALPAPDVEKLDAAEADAALTSARTVLQKLRLAGAVKERTVVAVEALAVAVAKRQEKLMAAVEAPRVDRSNEELKLIHETSAASAPLGREYRFTEAEGKLKALTITSPEAMPVRDAQADVWKKAHQFLEQLTKDLAARPAEGAITVSGVPARALISASGTALQARISTQPQPIVIPVSKAEPVLLLELATDIRTRITDSDDYYRRSELIHAFALRTGLRNTAEAAAAAMEAEWPPFRKTLNTLRLTEVVSGR